MHGKVQIAIASGKGGTGKTTLAVTLAARYAASGKQVALLDCDVEEPNANLFLKTEIRVKETVYTPVPRVDEDHCTGCGKCEEVCNFNAIVLIKKRPLVLPDMCHSCGGCVSACPEGVIYEVQKEIGTIEEGYGDHIVYAGGRLKIGQPIAPPLIKALKSYCFSADIRIIDAPPGTSCPAVESLRESDCAILVTEPTPFGLNDLKLAVGVVRRLGIPFGIVINRSDVGDNSVVDYCSSENIPLLASIPHSRQIAESYSRGDIIQGFQEIFPDAFEDIMSFVKQYAGSGKGA